MRLAIRQHGLVSVGQACHKGASPRHLARSGYWIRCRPGLYRLVGVPETWPSRLMEALATSPGAAVSHQAAAAVHGLDGFSAGRVRVEVSSVHKIRPRTGVTAHRVACLPRIDLERRNGLSVTSVTRTVIDIAGSVDQERLRQALESALRQRLTSVARIERRLAEMGARGRRGAAALRRLLMTYRTQAASDSLLESRFESLCQRHNLIGFIRQYSVGPFRVDYAWPDSKLLVELDGFAYHSSSEDHKRDLHRQNFLAMQLPGWTLLRFSWSDVAESAGHVIATLKAAIVRHPATGRIAKIDQSLIPAATDSPRSRTWWRTSSSGDNQSPGVQNVPAAVTRARRGQTRAGKPRPYSAVTPP